MSIFIAVKQIVDILWPFKILQFLMIGVAVVMMGYVFWKDRLYKNFWNRIQMADYLVVVLMILYFFSFLRNMDAKNQFLKTESAFLVYFLGRMYAERFIAAIAAESADAKNGNVKTIAGGAAKKSGKTMSADVSDTKSGISVKQFLCSTRMIALCAYVVVYANLIARAVKIFVWVKTGEYVGYSYPDIFADGGMYYYKTDMTLGIATMVMLIYLFSRMKWLKWITIFPVSLATAFVYSNGRSGQAILLFTYAMIAFWEWQKWRKRRKEKIDAGNAAEEIEAGNTAEKKSTGSIINCKAQKILYFLNLFVLLGLTALFIFIQVFPPLGTNYEDLGLSTSMYNKIERVFHARQLVWWNAMRYFRSQPFLTRLTGIDLCSEQFHNYRNIRFHTTYIKQIYSIGYLGCYVFWTLLYQIVKNFLRMKSAQGNEVFKQTESDPKNVALAQTETGPKNVALAQTETGPGKESLAQTETQPGNEHAYDTLKKYFILMWVMFLFMSFTMESLEYSQMSWIPMILAGMVVTLGSRDFIPTKWKHSK
ncbi:MAG: hypothetical protein ACI4DU_09595 [Lachnospiraceae bacterium]